VSNERRPKRLAVQSSKSPSLVEKKPQASKDDSRTLFDRLSARGIEYVEIKKIVSFDLPHATLFFERHFGCHSAPQVLRQVRRWNKLLRNDCILSAEQRREFDQTLSAAEMSAWRALIETSFPRLGPWHLSWTFLPTHEDPELRYIHPDIRIVAIQETTHQTRVAIVRGGITEAFSWGESWQRAFADLGLLELVLKRRTRNPLVSARHSQGWPIFTMVVIPRLYVFLAPFYRKRGHIWSAKENVLRRNAFFPKDLLDDMGEILRLEHPGSFPLMTRDQLKAVIQRHIGRTRQSTKSAR